MQARVYECKKCGERGGINVGFYVKIVGQKNPIRKVKHVDCNGDGKWLKGELLYVPNDNPFLDAIDKEYGIHMRDRVIVSDLEDRGELQVIGLKRGKRRKLLVDVWEEDTKFCWTVPIGNIKKIYTD